MKAIYWAFCVSLISGCAMSGTAMQAECEAQFTKFPDIYRCTHDAVVQRNPMILRDDRAKLYLLRGEQLSQAVEQGRVSDIDAKVMWQQLYVELKAAKTREQADSVALFLASRPKPAQQINCTSRSLGDTVTTDCN